YGARSPSRGRSALPSPRSAPAPRLRPAAPGSAADRSTEPGETPWSTAAAATAAPDECVSCFSPCRHELRRCNRASLAAAWLALKWALTDPPRRLRILRGHFVARPLAR